MHVLNVSLTAYMHENVLLRLKTPFLTATLQILPLSENVMMNALNLHLQILGRILPIEHPLVKNRSEVQDPHLVNHTGYDL